MTLTDFVIIVVISVVGAAVVGYCGMEVVNSFEQALELSR